ncbi:hypothetical protein V5O48_015424, partial [Marasmius crinis-equi]
FRQLVPSNRNNTNSQRARGRWVSLFIELMTQPYLYEQLLQLFDISVDVGGQNSHFDGVDVNYTMRELVLGLAQRGFTARHSYWMYDWAMQYLREAELLNRDTGYVREVPWVLLLSRAGHRIAEVGPPPVDGLPFPQTWNPPPQWDIPQYREERNRRLAAAGRLDKSNKRKQGINPVTSNQPSYAFPPPPTNFANMGTRVNAGASIAPNTHSPAVSRENPSPAVSRKGSGVGSTSVPPHLISGLSMRHPAHAQGMSQRAPSTATPQQPVPKPEDDDSTMHDGTTESTNRTPNSPEAPTIPSLDPTNTHMPSEPSPAMDNSQNTPDEDHMET